MKETYFNQCILCKVKSCKYYNTEGKCNLGQILVSADKKTTHCASYEKND